MQAGAYWQALLDDLAALADADNAKAMAQYMRHRFSFYGIKRPGIDEASKAFYAEHGQPPAEQLSPLLLYLWERAERECQCIAVDLLRKRAPQLDADAIELCEQLITQKSWWDTVDMLAVNVAGPLCKKHPELIDSHIQIWRSADDFWLRRSAILFQLKYKAHTDEALLFDIIKEQADEDEFFIRKAIGWALREYARTAPDRVRRFVDATPLKPLSRREALKHIG